MERKIGEIFEYNGEWYQCVESDNCRECSPFTTECSSGTKSDLAYKVFGKCSKTRRSDNKYVIFKKLEKVGEPYMLEDKKFQKYKIYYDPLIAKDGVVGRYVPGSVDIVIKQKEDMEEKKLNLKPFDLKAAKAGKPVCTRGGKKARIICFDRKFYHDGYNYPIVAMANDNDNDNDNELIHAYTQDGLLVGNMEGELDLMMLPEKKEGWVNVYRDCDGANITKDDNIYSSKEVAMAAAQIIDANRYVATTKINWEE